ncbi:hypothetical protein MPTK1_3g14750 [Marchantia polymorpha subsp. ruderalis]|uniref:Uncharacterized protein n=2 Tax=Marchantia polymorpha TaxID=3197 RepID=A0AAF6B0V7_MARPO|nr:hypothetical protein MARPO_0004s0196 [Marchantia polymorpha]BBN05641.1 hypothetical protein Mp_3g14750 [Marchantia polymorpha subsp. ruderalis]|eukprot:PTQ48941.1 hypothetical protein MARPO_0004s0196 [Marchantia polymorpha]
MSKLYTLSSTRELYNLLRGSVMVFLAHKYLSQELSRFAAESCARSFMELPAMERNPGCNHSFPQSEAILPSKVADHL